MNSWRAPEFLALACAQRNKHKSTFDWPFVITSIHITSGPCPVALRRQPPLPSSGFSCLPLQQIVKLHFECRPIRERADHTSFIEPNFDSTCAEQQETVTLFLARTANNQARQQPSNIDLTNQIPFKFNTCRFPPYVDRNLLDRFPCWLDCSLPNRHRLVLHNIPRKTKH